MIVLIGGEKGGAGKSTLATNLAAYLVAQEDKDVMLLDCDRQGSATKWIGRRNEAGYKEIFSAQKLGDVYKTAIDMGKRYEHVIIHPGSLRSGIHDMDRALPSFEGIEISPTVSTMAISPIVEGMVISPIPQRVALAFSFACCVDQSIPIASTMGFIGVNGIPS